MKLLAVRNGRQCELADGELRELPDGIREGCIRRLTESARRKEWKSTGFGAKFTGTYTGETAESVSARVMTRVEGIVFHGGELIFSESIDEVSGIYLKKGLYDSSEAIAVSSSDRRYGQLDLRSGRLAAAISLAGESHIAICEASGGQLSYDFRFVTDGNTLDSEPYWSRTEPETLYLASAGLPEAPEEAPTAPRGPSAILRLRLATGVLDALLEDSRYDYTSPQSDSEGNLWYLRRKYRLGVRRGLLGIFIRTRAPEPPELRRLTRDGRDESVRSGVSCFTLDGSDVVYSDGTGIFRLSTGERLCDGAGVSLLRFVEI